MKTHIERDRNYLPHLEIRGTTYFITLRLADTLPALVLHEIRMELLKLKRNHVDRKLNDLEERRLNICKTEEYKIISTMELEAVG